MDRRTWVLGITARPATLCATQSLLFAAGIELFTVADLPSARAAINALRVRGVIVCKHSWSMSERSRILADLAEVRPGLVFVMRCPGCQESDVDAGIVGHLPDLVQVNELIAAVAPAAQAS